LNPVQFNPILFNVYDTKVSTKFQFVLLWYSKTLYLIDFQWYNPVEINKKRGVLALFNIVFGVPKMLQIQLLTNRIKKKEK
ncbi:MAG: hypothetical protein V4577_13535, partial [Bacteroidota bacterium]